MKFDWIQFVHQNHCVLTKVLFNLEKKISFFLSLVLEFSSNNFMHDLSLLLLFCLFFFLIRYCSLSTGILTQYTECWFNIFRLIWITQLNYAWMLFAKWRVFVLVASKKGLLFARFSDTILVEWLNLARNEIVIWCEALHSKYDLQLSHWSHICNYL